MTPVVVSSVPPNRDRVGSVVHRDGGADLERGENVLVVGVVVLALDREHRYAVLVDQRRGHVVLRAERVARAQGHLGAAFLQGAHQIGGLRRDVETGRHPLPLHRELPGEPLPDLPQDRHVTVGPLDTELPVGRQPLVLDVELRH